MDHDDESTRVISQMRQQKERFRSESRNERTAAVIRNQRKKYLDMNQQEATQRLIVHQNISYHPVSIYNSNQFYQNQFNQYQDNLSRQQYPIPLGGEQQVYSRFADIPQNRYAYDFSQNQHSFQNSNQSFELSDDSFIEAGWEQTAAAASFMPQSPSMYDDERTRGFSMPSRQEINNNINYLPKQNPYFYVEQPERTNYENNLHFTQRRRNSIANFEVLNERKQVSMNVRQPQVINSLENVQIGPRKIDHSQNARSIKPLTKENWQMNSSNLPHIPPKSTRKYSIQMPSYKIEKETTVDVLPVKWADISQSPKAPLYEKVQQTFNYQPQRWALSPVSKPKYVVETQKHVSPTKNTVNIIQIKDFQFSLSDKIGEGSFSTVYLGYKLNDREKEKVAVKIIDMTKQGSKFRDEIAICLKVSGHKNILRTYDHFIDMDKKKCYLFLEFCNQGSLQTQLDSISRVQAIAYFRQVVEGMRELLRHNIIHRDIKLDNILLSNGEVKISDFGLSKQVYTDRLDVNSMKCGTPSTMAPEIFFAKTTFPSYNHKCDVWSLGVILHEMFYKIHPFDMNQEMLRQLQRVRIEQPCPMVEEFLRVSLVQNPKVRCSLDSIIGMDVYKQKLSLFETFKKESNSSMIHQTPSAPSTPTKQFTPSKKELEENNTRPGSAAQTPKNFSTYILLAITLALLLTAILATFPHLIQ